MRICQANDAILWWRRAGGNSRLTPPLHMLHTPSNRMMLRLSSPWNRLLASSRPPPIRVIITPVPLNAVALGTGEVSCMPLRTRLKRDAEKPFAHGAALSSKSCASSEGLQHHPVITPLPNNPTIFRATALPILGMQLATASNG